MQASSISYPSGYHLFQRNICCGYIISRTEVEDMDGCKKSNNLQIWRIAELLLLWTSVTSWNNTSGYSSNLKNNFFYFTLAFVFVLRQCFRKMITNLFFYPHYPQLFFFFFWLLVLTILERLYCSWVLTLPSYVLSVAHEII